jgi:DNA polymerase-4
MLEFSLRRPLEPGLLQLAAGGKDAGVTFHCDLRLVVRMLGLPQEGRHGIEQCLLLPPEAEDSVSMKRSILHVDMDAFYASVEQHDNPDLKGKPVIVGKSDRGVVCAASYEARKFGVRSAMPVFQARRMCPDGVFLPVRMGRYQEVSQEIRAVLDAISPLVEPVSIDEAFIDITGTEGLHGSPVILAQNLKRAILDRTSLTCSVGIAPNKLLAKIASDLQKPDGITIVTDSEVLSFLHPLPIGKIPGIGLKTGEMMRSLGITYVGDILKFPPSFWNKRLGKRGGWIYELAKGIDDSPVIAGAPAKSCGAENTYRQDTGALETIRKYLRLEAEEVGASLRKDGQKARTITLKIKYSDFRTETRSHTMYEPTDCTRVIYTTALMLLNSKPLPRSVRLTGISASQFAQGPQQVQLFKNELQEKQERLDAAMDRIRHKFGNDAVKVGRVIDDAS